MGAYMHEVREACGEAVLVRIVLVHCSGAGPADLALGHKHRGLLRSHQRLRAEYRKLIGVTAELTAGLEEVARARLGGAPGGVDWRGILARCSGQFPELFGNRLEHKPGEEVEVEEMDEVVEETVERPNWSRTPEMPEACEGGVEEAGREAGSQGGAKEVIRSEEGGEGGAVVAQGEEGGVRALVPVVPKALNYTQIRQGVKLDQVAFQTVSIHSHNDFCSNFIQLSPLPSALPIFPEVILWHI
jgi:hypothetical protein